PKAGCGPRRVQKKSRRAVITMAQETSEATISGLCRREGISRQAYYQACKRYKKRNADGKQVLEWVHEQRRKHPRMGGRKLYHRLKSKMVGPASRWAATGFSSYCAEKGCWSGREEVKNRIRQKVPLPVGRISLPGGT